MRTALAAACCAAALAGCGGDEESGRDDEGLTPPPAASAPSTSPGVAQGCGRVEVPGHEAIEVRAENVACEAARQVAAAAEGQGRRAYEAADFSCEPAEASGGATRYTCTAQPGERITFLYDVTPEL